MGTYVTRDDLLAVDGSLVWNMAIDKSTQQLDEAKIETAIDDADAEINSFLAKRFQLPLNIAPIPRPLHRVSDYRPHPEALRRGHPHAERNCQRHA